jgi:hypothetical protein
LNTRSNWIALLVVFLFSSCTETLDVQERFERAKETTLTQSMEPGYRARALGDWYTLDEPDTRATLTADQQKWVDFGIASLTLIDLSLGATDLLGFTEDTDSAENEDASDADETAEEENGDELDLDASVIRSLLERVQVHFISDLAERWRNVEADKNFSATFECPLEVQNRYSGHCVFEGTVNYGEIAFFAGIFSLVDTILNQVLSREGLIEFAVDLFVNPPELDRSKGNLFRQIPAIAYTTLEDFATTNYGSSFAGSKLFQVESQTLLNNQKTATLEALQLLIDGLTHSQSDSEEDSAFAGNTYVRDLLERLGRIDVDNSLELIAITGEDNISGIDVLAQELTALRSSINASSNDGQRFYFPSFYGELRELLSAADIDLDNPVDMHFPSFWFGALYSAEWLDPKKALLPAADTANKRFFADFEQEPYKYVEGKVFYDSSDGLGSAEDAGVATTTGTAGAGNGTFNDLLGKRDSTKLSPIAHIRPDTSVQESANNWVDPIYMFWENGSLGGLLGATVQTNANTVFDINNDKAEFGPDASVAYGNERLNGFVSSILYIASGLVEED